MPKKQFQLWLDERLKAALEYIASVERYSMSSIVHIALEYLLTGEETAHVQTIRNVYNADKTAER